MPLGNPVNVHDSLSTKRPSFSSAAKSPVLAGLLNPFPTPPLGPVNTTPVSFPDRSRRGLTPPPDALTAFQKPADPAAANELEGTPAPVAGSPNPISISMLYCARHKGASATGTMS